MISQEFFKHADEPYIKDIQRLAFQIKDYENRIKTISENTKALVEYFKKASFIDEIFYCLSSKYASNYKKLMIDENSLTGIISAFIGQHYSLIESANIGTYLHGYIADELLNDQYIINASHIIENISKYIKEIFK